MRPPLVDPAPPLALWLCVALAACLVFAWAVERSKRIQAQERIAGHQAAVTHQRRRAAAWEASRDDALLELNRTRHELYDLQDKFAEVCGFHDEWGDTDAEKLDRLDLWEELGRIIATGHRSRPADPPLDDEPIPFVPNEVRS